MLHYKNLPDHIKKVAKEYDLSSSRIDCLPSKFYYNGQNYYVISYYPTLQDLYVREDGSVPPYEEVKRVTLIVHVYQTAGETIIKTGGEWALSPSAKLYRRWEKVLASLKSKLQATAPPEIMESINRCLESAKRLRLDQEIIFNSVEKGTDLIVGANDTELVTEETQQRVRACVVEMVRAAVRKNDGQLKTERDRKEILAYLHTVLFKRPSILLDYFWFMRNEPHMLSSDSETGREMPELREMVKVDKPVYELDNKEELYRLLMNPR